MFHLLAQHEERDPKSVLQTQSKRGQKRLQREEKHRLEAAANTGDSWSEATRAQDPDNAAAHLYEELYGSATNGYVDPSLLGDIAASMQRLSVGRQNSGKHQHPQQQQQHHHTALHTASVASGGGRAGRGAGPGPCLSTSGFLPGPGPGNHIGNGHSNPRLLLLPLNAGTPPRGAIPSLPASSPYAGRAPGPAEDFPALRAAASTPSTSAAASAGTGWKAGHRGKHGGHAPGVKVLHSARPASHTPDTGHGGSAQLKGLKGHSYVGGVGKGGDGGDFSLSLLWDLLGSGWSLLPDVLADAEANGGQLEGPGPAALAAIRRLVQAQSEAEDGPARGISQEDMIAMMTRAHRRQYSSSGSRRAGGAHPARRGGGAGGDAEGDGGGGGGSSSSSGSDCDEEHYYTRQDDSRSWRRTVDFMEKNDWLRVTDTDGKHFKYRRLLPNGKIQTQTVCCSSSDALRGVRNLQADLQRKDTEANTVIKGWRGEQRLAKKAAVASAASTAAAAAAQDD